MIFITMKSKNIILISFVLLCLPLNILTSKLVNTRTYVLTPGKVISSKDLGQYDLNIFCYRGLQHHLLHVWQTTFVRVDLHPDDYEMFIGSSREEVIQEYDLHRSSWRVPIFNWKSENVKINPFNQTCLGIQSVVDYNIVLQITRVDFWKVVLLATGITLFLSAPQLSNNPLFYYICGIGLGVSTSFLILVYLLSKLIPRKPMMYTFLAGGWTIGVYVFQLMWENVRSIALNYHEYVLGYICLSALISFVICYRFGPVSDPKSKNLIKWTLQIAGLIMIFFSSHFQEVGVIQIFLLLSYYNFPSRLSNYFILLWKRSFPPRMKILSEDEYHQQGAKETVKALEELRKYCSSPECNQWRTVLKLKQPLRFAEFVEGRSHLEDSEILDYEASTFEKTPDTTDDELSEEHSSEEEIED